MKSKKLLFSAILSLACVSSYIIFSSSATATQGVMGASQIGCAGTCHGGTANPATAITITGIPASGFVNGTNYPLTLTVSNSTKLGAGFDMSVTSGTMSNAPANTMLMGGGTELHHTQKQNFVAPATSATWNFNWTAPSAGSTATFHVAANAVNNNNADSGDQWNKVSLSFNAAVPSAISDIDQTGIVLYPNPAVDQLTLRTHKDATMFKAVSLNGSIQTLPAQKINGEEYLINTAALASGNYILLFTSNGTTSHTMFSKK